MDKSQIVAQFKTQEEKFDLSFIFRVAMVGYRAKQLGRQARDRMKKGDYSNKPIKHKSKKQKKSVKGYS